MGGQVVPISATPRLAVRLIGAALMVATMTAAADESPLQQSEATTQNPGIQGPNIQGSKMQGLVFTGPHAPPLEEGMFASMADIGGTFVALVPEATVYRQTLNVVWDFEGQWYGETTDAALEGIRLARQAGLQVMLKPHLNVGWDLSGWKEPELDFTDPDAIHFQRASLRAYTEQQKDRTVSRDSWRGAFDVRSEEDWTQFADAYRRYLLGLARLAEEHSVELFCVGTELKRIALERPDFWRSLIRDVRKTYRGSLVYAANWDSFDQIEFWDLLDYIGIDAYFPVSPSKTPTIEEIESGWQETARRIAELQSRFDKPVLFTEWGYEDEDYAGLEPWVMGRPADAGSEPNQEAQANAYEGMFRSLWSESWMHGVFVWRWQPSERSGNAGYSPRGKRAEDVLRRWFSDVRVRDEPQLSGVN